MAGETEREPSGFTVDTAMATWAWRFDDFGSSIDQRLADLGQHLDERYATQVKAIDAAFAAQQLAMTTAFAAADKAVAAALESAEKAVEKAERASEKRFESVNEFRAQLSDQTATFMPRTESTTRWQALSEKLDTHAKTADERVAKLELRLEKLASIRDGGGEQSQRTISIIGAVAGVAAIIGVLVTLFAVLAR